MPADFISNLYVFILAGFVGFEVIKRVSPLLHTPLMSLTNALDAIVVVAAIIIAGRHETRLSTVLGSDRGGGFVQQYGRRIPHHRPHAAHVQIRQVEKIMTALVASAVSRFRLHCRGRSLHSVSQVAEFAGDGARGVLAGEIGAALAVVATLFNPELTQYKWIIIALIIGAGVGIPLGMVHMTAVPQRTALEPCLRRAFRRDDRYRRILRGHAPVTRFRWGKSGWK